MQTTPSYRLLWLIPIIVLALLGVVAYRDRVQLVEITDTDSIILPTHVKHRLLTENDSELLYVDYHANQLHYYFRSQNQFRRNLILETMHKLIVSLRYKVMPGRYLFVLHDGAHHTYECPVLAFATKTEFIPQDKIVLIPDPNALKGYFKLFMDLGRNAPRYPWQNKIAKIFWRGSTTGIGPENNDLNGCARFRFMNYAVNAPYVDAGFTRYEQMNSEFQDRFSAIHKIKATVSPIKSLAYKYLLDIDGNTCSFSRMAWILRSNSLLMKHRSNLVQWYYPRLHPYVHYLPINEDFSNLEEQFLWAEAHPQEAKQIAENGHKLAQQIFNSNAVLKSFEQALLQYHALLN